MIKGVFYKTCILAVINWCDCIVNRHGGETWNEWEGKFKSVMIIVEQLVNWRSNIEKRNCIKIIYDNNSVVYVHFGNHYCWTNNIL